METAKGKISELLKKNSYNLFRMIIDLGKTFTLFFQETGWIPQHIVAKDEHDNILGVVPLYLKRFCIYFLGF